MPLLLEQLQWDEPLVPEVVDPTWEEQVRSIMHVVPTSFRRMASSTWVRQAYLDFVRTPPDTLSTAEMELAGLVTSQENACRYCYGSARVRMKMIGFSDDMIDRIERNAQLVEADPRERELVTFCRNLARSKPRPSRAAREAMQAVGYSPLATAELAATVAVVGFCNRISTLLAFPPELEMEADGSRMKGIWNKLTAWLPKREAPRLPAPEYPPPTFAGPYGKVLEPLRGSPMAGTLEAVLNAAFSSPRLPRRTMAMMFAVVARTLECELCEISAAALLEAEGFPRANLAEVLATLGGGGGLTEMESMLLPWARDTVWMPEQPKRIQERTRPLRDAFGPELLVEAVGAAALANGCVRLTMLQV
jgi:uncharacterized peroxidase-related enzyme